MSGLVPMMSIAYPTAPQMLPWLQLPNVQARQWRMLQFGTYLFPVTFQMRNAESKLSPIKKKLPFTPGDYIPGNTSMGGRTLEFFGTVGVGMIGFGGSLITGVEQLETERQYLAGLQDLGQQSLYVGPDQFIWAYLEDFTYTPLDATGFRYADWTAKFYCPDPRWYGASSWQLNSGNASSVQGGLPNMNVLLYTHSGTGSGSVGGNHTVVQGGNTKAFPIFVLTVISGLYGQPTLGISTAPASSSLNQLNAAGISVTFSKFNNTAPNVQMQPGDQLILFCDPRPEYQLLSATYVPGGGWPQQITQPVNAWQFCVPGNGDLANGIDFQYFMPWISSSTVDDGSGGMNTFYFNANATDQGSGVAHQIELMYYDTIL